jgi:hypothetical protein
MRAAMTVGPGAENDVHGAGAKMTVSTRKAAHFSTKKNDVLTLALLLSM